MPSRQSTLQCRSSAIQVEYTLLVSVARQCVPFSGIFDETPVHFLGANPPHSWSYIAQLVIQRNRVLVSTLAEWASLLDESRSWQSHQQQVMLGGGDSRFGVLVRTVANSTGHDGVGHTE